MTNPNEVETGLSQCHPGPLEPVEFTQQPGAAPATGNTARDQEMYAAGIEVGEANAKHNAAIRAGVPDGWKLVPIKATDEMEVAAENDYVETGYTFPRWKSHYTAMIAAAPAAPGVSTVEDACAQKEAVKDAIAAALNARDLQQRLNDLYIALEVCSAELFAQCGDQRRALKYVEQARKALAAEQCARAARAAQRKGGA